MSKNWDSIDQLTKKIDHYVDLRWAAPCNRILGRIELIILVLLFGSLAIAIVGFVDAHTQIIEKDQYQVIRQGDRLVKVNNDTSTNQPDSSELKALFLAKQKRNRWTTIIYSGMALFLGFFLYKIQRRYYKSLLYGCDGTHIYIYSKRWFKAVIKKYHLRNIRDFKYKGGGLNLQEDKKSYNLYIDDLSGTQELLEKWRSELSIFGDRR